LTGISNSQKSPRNADPANRVRDAIGSLKSRVESKRPGSGTDEQSKPVTLSRGRDAGDAKSVGTSGAGTSGALSVENRYPATPPSASSSNPPPGHHVLSRAGSVVRGAGAGTWMGILCLIAGALVIALVLRRSRTAT
jgi:hypothetical protein